MTTQEVKKIIITVDSFALEMKAKLIQKGRTEWDDSKSILEQLVNHVAYAPQKQAIDIANLAMMLWYHSMQEEIKEEQRKVVYTNM